MVMNTKIIDTAVRASLAEDVGEGDITAALLPVEQHITATMLTRETAILCGRPWAEKVFQLLDPQIQLKWSAADGERLAPNQRFVEITGPSRAIITGERTALNWLQTLSGTATTVAAYVAQLAGTNTQLLDTRKTIPGLRYAQKYAVKCGGGHNHRMGLYDAYLIKENHIISCGSIAAAIQTARTQHPDKTIEIEVENVMELQQAIDAGAQIILLDNFDLAAMSQAVKINQRQAKLEVSGGVSLTNIRQIAEAGVDFISVGALTKHVQAIDLSMRFEMK
jgi:nicotinate-nucleotide pyrophosphorylase (carboxylating)